MRHALFGTTTCNASIAILVKESNFNTGKIVKHYIAPLNADPKAFIAFTLWFNEHNKCPAGHAKEYLKGLLLELERLSIKIIAVTDANYFKYLTKASQAEINLGYVLDSQIDGFQHKFQVVYVPNYKVLEYNPKNQDKIDLGLSTLRQFTKGTYNDPGFDIIHSAKYPDTWKDCVAEMKELYKLPELTVDIESKGLQFWNCGLATIAFGIDKHNFVAFGIDRGRHPASMRMLLKDFFSNYKGKLIFHGANFDIKVLVFNLWMKHLQDYRGMIEGIQILTSNFDDTKIITYLATNNAIENVLSLKKLSAIYAGNYAKSDIANTEAIELPDLLRYNGIDTLSTWFVREKFYPLMVKDQQEDLYHSLFKPSIITLLQTELVGLPIFPHKVKKAKNQLKHIVDTAMQKLLDSNVIQDFHHKQQERKCAEFTAEAVKKIFKMSDPRVVRYVFNPSSPDQLRRLFYEYMALPVSDTTDTGLPATGSKTIKKLLVKTKDKTFKDILETLIIFSKANKILSTFIPAFENAVQMPDGSYRLYGNFNLGGTLSGRLSSSDPNLTNLPSSSTWADIIKQCFGTIKGWVFGGADFNALEDMVSALTTKDPNKLKVYIDGFDGHSLRAYYYFKAHMGNINPDSVKSINSIKKLYKAWRTKSKPVTFLLTYGGTFHGIIDKLGFTESDAKRIEANYHELYKISDEWVKTKIKAACKTGYVTGAFGLRLRTPLLEKVGKGKISYMAQGEARTAGNMLGQSYGLLNSRAANEFRERVWNSKYKYDIFLCCQIHDAIYLIWRDQIGIAKWVNDNLIACMKWCGLKELQHPIVKLGAELDIFYPDWNNGITIPNDVPTGKIKTICTQALKEI
ncbi:MAG: hypothetical protein DRH06_00305 [Deltaproteobacteria bacterium]|nr:MAG: hypothetical protein DRH06_00305 [Deltaproteobacteria bacterium]